MPRWLQARPFLLAGVLSWSNFQRQYRALLPALVVLLLVSGGLLTIPVVGHLLEVVAQFPVTPFVLLGGASGLHYSVLTRAGNPRCFIASRG
jgi:hypothetical protein